MATAVAWTLFGLYIAGTFWLAWLGHRRTSDFASFAVGKRDMGPGMAGLTLGACLASTLTFVLNPGLVYQWGLPALIALSVPLFAGIFAGLAILGPGFRRFGGQSSTLPAWLGNRYGSRRLRTWFAALCVLNVFYIVGIVVGAAKVMEFTMSVPYWAAVLTVVGVVFSYVFLGGTYAHAYTNSAQGAVMLVVALVIAGFAFSQMGTPGAALVSLAEQDPHLAALSHPESPLYRNWFEVLVCPFVVGFALVAQPHLLLKSLYLKRTRDLATFSVIGGGSFMVFSLVLLAGLAARLELGAGLSENAVVAYWLSEAFPPLLGAVVGVAILAAAMSTLDGLLVAVSAIVGADIAGHPAVASRLGCEDAPARNRLSFLAGRVTVVVLGAVALAAALIEPPVVAIFCTVGVFGLLVASLPGLVFGILLRRPPPALGVGIASAIAVVTHLGLYYGGWSHNPGVTAAVGLAVSLPVPFFVPRAASSAERSPAAAAREAIAAPERGRSERLVLSSS